mgnify:CR=1 FL=1
MDFNVVENGNAAFYVSAAGAGPLITANPMPSAAASVPIRPIWHAYLDVSGIRTDPMNNP